MAEVQHQDARTLLKILTAHQSNPLTYSQVACMMGRPKDHARAIAATCNLLDAAACLAGIPLLALVAVLGESRQVNPAAFAKEFDQARRQEIISRSQRHEFVAADYRAIAEGLEHLGDKGAVSAWRFISNLYPGELLYLRLVGRYTDSNCNAIDDIGADAPDRYMAEVWTYLRDPRVRQAVLTRADGRCEFCGREGFLKVDGIRYLESHHVIALAKDGEDRVTNVIALCPNDHREAHFGQRRKEMEDQMILRLKALNGDR